MTRLRHIVASVHRTHAKPPKKRVEAPPSSTHVRCLTICKLGCICHACDTESQTSIGLLCARAHGPLAHPAADPHAEARKSWRRVPDSAHAWQLDLPEAKPATRGAPPRTLLAEKGPWTHTKHRPSTMLDPDQTQPRKAQCLLGSRNAHSLLRHSGKDRVPPRGSAGKV